MEQIYMRLEDKTKRPTLDLDNFNRSNKSFRRLVESYRRWYNEYGDHVDEECEADIISCLKDRVVDDGYALAKRLEKRVGIEGDSSLVEVLEDVFYVRRSLEEELVKQWVKECFLEISEGVIGKRVNVKQGCRKYEGYYITSIIPEVYQVTIGERADWKRGHVINFENIEFINEMPKFPENTILPLL